MMGKVSGWFLEIEGTVRISDDESIKENVWNEHMKPWFSGPEESNLVIFEVVPDSISLMNKKGEEPNIIELRIEGTGEKVVPFFSLPDLITGIKEIFLIA